MILAALVYLISPVDLIPDILLPYIGWIDDGVIIYLIRYGKLPNFLLQRLGPFRHLFTGSPKKSDSANASRKNRTRRDTKTSQHIPKPAHEILGVRPDASKKEIQAAYKKAIKKYHPDKISHLGEEFAALANEKFLEIQDAYDRLMKS